MLLREILTAVKNKTLGGMKFFVTSRSSPEIVALCDSFPSDAVCRLQNVPIDEVEQDIRMYLQDKLPNLGNSELVKIERRAAGLFIYAATAVRYLTRRSSITASEQTKMLQVLLSKTYVPASAGKATFLIDELYRQILRDAFSELEGDLFISRLHILHTILCTAERASTSVVAALLPETDESTANAVLGDLHAVLYVQDGQVFWYHASFPDFIFDCNRANFTVSSENFSFWCDETVHHSLLTRSCFRIMQDGLKFNIGGIPSPFQFDSDHSSHLSAQIDRNITAALRYSSCHWIFHLPLSMETDTDYFCRSISDFLQLRVLFWIEAMNLLGFCKKCTLILRTAHEWLMVRIML